MNNLNQNAQRQDHDHHHTAAGIATIWAVLLALVVGFELASLLLSRSILAGVFH